MFDRDQVINLLQSPVWHADETIKSMKKTENQNEGLINLEDQELEKAVTIISGYVKEILLSSAKTNESEPLQERYIKNSRIHAVLFFTTLRSNDISSEEADDFYESLIDFLPPIGWDLYFQLVETCDWEEQFVECAGQLPVDIFTRVLGEVIRGYFKTNVQYFRIHIFFQALIQKLFIVKPALSSDFHFGFTDFAFDGSTKNYLSDEASLFDICEYITTLMEVISAESCNLELSKVILCACTKLLYHLINHEFEAEKENQIIEKLKRLFTISKEYFTEDCIEKTLKVAMNELATTEQVIISSSVVSWYLPESHVAFVHFHYWKSFLQKSNLDSTFDTWIENTNEFVEGLYSHHPIHNQHPAYEEIPELLLWILEKGLPGHSYAANFLVQNPVLLEKERALECLKSSCTSEQLYELLMSITNVQIIAQKDKLISVLFDMLPNIPVSEQNKLFLQIYKDKNFKEIKIDGVEEELLKLDDITLSEEMTVKTLGYVCLISPSQVLNHIVLSFVKAGKIKKHWVKALNFMSAACLYQPAEDELPLLIQALKPVFELSSTDENHKNILVLMDILIEVNMQEKIFSPELVVKICLPHLKPIDLSNVDKEFNLLLGLKIMRVILSNFNETTYPAQEFYEVLGCLGFVLNTAICENLIALRELAVETLCALKSVPVTLNDNMKMELENEFSHFDVQVSFYMLEFLPKILDPVCLSLPYLWSLCCITEEDHFDLIQAKVLEHKRPQQYLICSLAVMTSSFTRKEYTYSASLLERVYRKLILKMDLNKTIPEEELVHYFVLRSLIECLEYYRNSHTKVPSYHLCNLYSIIKNVLQKKVLKCCLPMLFLDMRSFFCLVTEGNVLQFQEIFLELVNEASFCKDKCISLFLKNAFIVSRNSKLEKSIFDQFKETILRCIVSRFA